MVPRKRRLIMGLEHSVVCMKATVLRKNARINTLVI